MGRQAELLSLRIPPHVIRGFLGADDERLVACLTPGVLLVTAAL